MRQYSTGFKVGALFYVESQKVVELYSSLRNWTEVRTVAINQNLLQIRTSGSRQRIVSEVISRLRCLDEAEIEIFMNECSSGKRYLLWLCICRRYRLIGDFAAEVLRENFLGLKSELGYAEFDAFWFRKVEWNQELSRVNETSRKKARGVIFRMLREANLLDLKGCIVPLLASNEILLQLKKSGSNGIGFFPVAGS